MVVISVKGTQFRWGVPVWSPIRCGVSGETGIDICPTEAIIAGGASILGFILSWTQQLHYLQRETENMQSALKAGFGLALLAGLGLTAARPAAAQITIYSSQSGLNGAATVSGPYNFDAYVAPGSNAFMGGSFAFSPTGPGGTTTVTFTDPNKDLYLDGRNVSGGLYTNAFNTSAIDTNNLAGPPSTLNVLAPNTTAFGIQFAIANGQPGDTGSVTITVFDATHPLGISAGTFTATEARDATPAAFFGVTDTSNITGIAFSGSSTDVALSNFSYGKANLSTVPEPSSVASMGLGGFGLLGLLLRARKRRTAA